MAGAHALQRVPDRSVDGAAACWSAGCQRAAHGERRRGRRKSERPPAALRSESHAATLRRCSLREGGALRPTEHPGVSLEHGQRRSAPSGGRRELIQRRRPAATGWRTVTAAGGSGRRAIAYIHSSSTSRSIVHHLTLCELQSWPMRRRPGRRSETIGSRSIRSAAPEPRRRQW